jgi:hypothetical protein
VIELLGVRLALVAIGLMAPLAVAASWPALRRLEAEMGVRDADIEILRGIRMLGALPAATIEQLGAGLEHAEFVPRQTVFEQGDEATLSRVSAIKRRSQRDTRLPQSRWRELDTPARYP